MECKKFAILSSICLAKENTNKMGTISHIAATFTIVPQQPTERSERVIIISAHPPFSRTLLPLSSSLLLNQSRNSYIIRAKKNKKVYGVSSSSRLGEEEIMGSTKEGGDDRIAKISSAIRVIPDFPKPGVMFQDITTLLLDPKAFKDTIDLFVERYKDKQISVVAGIEARGFIFGPPIALAIGAKFVPMRKPKKLPGEVISEEYSLEYGTDKIEMHVGAVESGERALIIDDLIATGGTMSAAIRLLERVGVVVVECACVIELPELKGRDRLGDKPLFVLVSADC